MIKKFFLFVVMMCLATVGSWADDVTTIESQTQWTFGTYAGQSAKVLNQNGVYLHAASTFDTFTVDADHAASLEGTFTGTNVAWQTTGALVAATGVGSNFLSLGNIDAASEGGADASLAFSHQGSGRLYVVYGAVSSEDGTFYVQQRKDGETAFTTVFSETLQGISYSGPLNAPVYNRTAGDYSFTQKESVVSLSGNGTVYFGADQPYCIYAIFWIPTYLDNPAYGTYDFQTWAEKNMTANNQATISVTADGTMTGAFTPASGDITGTMELNGVFSITGEAYKLRKNGSTGNNNSGLMITKTGGAKVTINRLQAGDWFTIATDVENRLQFASANANVHAAGSAETIEQDDYVQSGTIYLATAATTVDVYSKAVGTVYIHRVQISDEDAVAAPVITVGEGNLVTIDGGTSLKGNAVTIYYTLDNTDPKTSATRQLYTAPFTPTETSKVRAYSYLTGDETVVSEEAEPKAVRYGTWTGEVNVFDFASAANNYVDITFSDTKLDDVRMYGGGSSPDAAANFYPISNTEWLTASEGNTAAVAWREKGAKFDNGGVTPNGQTYFTVANLTEGQRVRITYYGRLRYRTNVADTAPVVLNENGEAIVVDTYFGTANQDNTTTFTVQSGSYMVFLCATSDVVVKNVTVLEPLQKFTLTATVNDADRGSVAVSPEGTEFVEGTGVTVTATPNSGYVFSMWTDANDNQLSLDNPYTFAITANTTVKAVFDEQQNNLGTTVPVIIVAGQSNTDGRVPVDDLPSIETEYTGLQNCYWSYCNALTAGGSGLKTPYTTEGEFKLYEPLNDAGGGWGFDAVVYNEIGKYLKENYDENFYVIKQSKGNTGISPVSGGCGLFWSANPLWLSRNTKTNEGGMSLLKSLIANIDASLAAIAEQHPDKEADIKFLMWHQGECDGAGGQGAVYYIQLKAMINYVRNYLAQKNSKYSNLPIILGGIPAISDQYREEVEAAKQQLANEDANIYYVAADMMTNKETDLLPESTTVHFNAKSAKAFGAAVWQTISDNHLLYGLQNGTGTAEPVADILAETVLDATTKWDFSTETANTKYNTLTDKNGLYLAASASKNMTVKEMSGVTSVKYRDSEEVTTSKALYSEAADRTNYTKYGLTAGDPSSLDRSFGINVSEAGTFYAIVAPNTEPSEAQASRNIFLVVNGEKVVEKNALEAWGNDNHMVELKYKMTAPGTIFLMSSHAYNLYAAKFVKSGEEHDPVEVEVQTEEGTATATVTLLDETHAELTALNVTEESATLTISGTVQGVPITVIANNVFTAENTANVAAIDLSETAITLTGDRTTLGALKNINPATLIYLPQTAAVTGTNVVTNTGTGFVCADYQLTDGNVCAVPHHFTATAATMNRVFVADKKSTVCLPFSFTATGGTFYKFTGINDGKVQMTAQQDGSALEANTPYIFEPASGTQTIAAQNVEVSISDAPQTDNMEAQYSFIGTYQPIVWENPVGIYGFAAEAQGPTSIGQFVRVGSGASIAACRSYLQYTGEGTITEARSNRSMSELPERYDIQWILSGETTMITTVKNTAADAARCYNLNGQLVNDSYRGIVIKNGKTMIKK